MKTPERIAAELVTVKEVEAGWLAILGGTPILPAHKYHGYRDVAEAEDYAAPLRLPIAAAIREAVNNALQSGLGEPPVSDERVAEIGIAVSRLKDLSYGPSALMNRETRELYDLVLHYRRLVAALARDGESAAETYRDGYSAGLAEGERRAMEALDTKAPAYATRAEVADAIDAVEAVSVEP